MRGVDAKDNADNSFETGPGENNDAPVFGSLRESRDSSDDFRFRPELLVS